MNNYIDGFIFPIAKTDLNHYQAIAAEVAKIWKEYGALAYFEFVGDDMTLEGVRSFTDALQTDSDEVVIFGWVVFPSKEVRDTANQQVPQDARMEKLVAPLVAADKVIFDASRMVYGGFKPLVEV